MKGRYNPEALRQAGLALSALAEDFTTESDEERRALAPALSDISDMLYEMARQVESPRRKPHTGGRKRPNTDPLGKLREQVQNDDTVLYFGGNPDWKNGPC